ncbi:MAG: hypothetical protein MUC97_18305 [Bernardetiaceae bacterium]|jgi:hypothetical protein|nr:hypothetical protein [Bernardetiaceae bacterium]
MRPVFLFLILGSLCAFGKRSPSTGQPPVSSLTGCQVAATDTLKWDTELCTHIGTFDPKRYTKEQLINTFHLWFGASGVQLSARVVAFEYEDISALELPKLDREYQAKKQRLATMPLVNDPYWQQLRQQRLLELENEYELSRAAGRAYTDPTALRQGKFARTCPEFADILTTTDTAAQMRFWEKFEVAQSKLNGDPNWVIRKFKENSRSPQWRQHFRVRLVTFGWSNCVNATLPHTSYTEEMRTKYNALFSKIEEECDEP